MQMVKEGWKLVKSLQIVHDTFKKQLHRWHKSCRSHCWPERKRACRQSGLQPPECLDTPCPCSFTPTAPAWKPFPGAPNPSCHCCSPRWLPAKWQSCALPAFTFSSHTFGLRESMFSKKKKQKKEVRGGKAERPQGWAVHLTNSLGGDTFILLKKTFNKSLWSHDLHVCFLFVFPHQLNSCFPST